MYWKQAVPLRPDPARAAVKADDAGAVAAAVGGVGLDAAGVTASVLNGWWFVAVPPGGVGGAGAGGGGIEKIVAGLAAAPGIAFASPVFVDDLGGPSWIGPDVFVGFDAKLTPAERDGIIAASGAGTLKVRDYTLGVDRLAPASKDGFAVLAAANALAGRAEVLFAEPDMAVTGRGGLVPNDPFFNQLWALQNTGQSGGVAGRDMAAVPAWDITTGSASVIVGVMDIGVQPDHPDLNLAPGGDFTGSPALAGAPANACDKHGTAVAGCIAARINNALGVCGVAPACRVSSLRIGVSNSPCDGTWNGFLSWSADALNFAQANGHRVTNNSNAYGGTSATVETAYLNTYNAGLVHFASNGNSGAGSIAYPASIAIVNGVAAIDRTGAKASFSQFGPGTDFCAPGVAIISTDRTGADGYVNGDYASVDGTSFASPYAAGVAALVVSRNPALTSAQVESILRTTATDLGAAGYDTTFGNGLVNARAALVAANATLVPANALCANAAALSPGLTSSTSLNGGNEGATTSCGNGNANATPDVYYRFVAPCTATFRFETDLIPAFDTVLSVHSGCPATAGNELGCNDDYASPNRGSRVDVALVSGTAYIVRVAGYAGASGAFNLTVSQLPPANDACASALALTLGSAAGATCAAAADGEGSCGRSTVSPDVYYAFTPSCTGRYRFETPQVSPYDTVVSVHTGCPATAANEIACNDDFAPPDRGSRADADLTAGTAYLVRVAGYNGASGVFTLTAGQIPQTNDVCSGAGPLGRGATALDTCGAFSEGTTEGSCSLSGAFNKDLWYVFTPTRTARTVISTCGSTFDTVLGVWAGSCPAAAGAVLVCDDDSCPPRQSRVAFVAQAGTPYYVRLGAYSTGSGPATLTRFCPADFNQGGSVELLDIFAFLNAWFARDPAADFNGVGGVELLDIFAFLNAWFSGCGD
jgi:hypothetical protein